jgi:hypothetical protein
VSAAANQALHALGLEIKLGASDVLNDGAKGSFAAPLLTISYRDDQNALEAAATALGQKLTTGSLQQVTGSLQQLALGPQAKVTLSMGGAAVAVDASPAFTSPADGGGPLGASESLSSIATGASPSAPTVEGLTVSASPVTRASRAVRARPVARPAGFLGGFGGLGWGMVLAAVAAAAALAAGLHRYALALDADRAGASSACPSDPLH